MQEQMVIACCMTLSLALYADCPCVHIDMHAEDYIRFISGVGSHNDSYAEAIHRQWAANYFLDKKPPEECTGAENHDTPSIGAYVIML